MNPNDLAKELITAAERRASMYGMQLGHGADADIRQFARTGASQMFAAHPTPEPPTQMVEEAKAAFERLIDEMVLAASEIPGYQTAHPGTIGEETLARALSRLCPLFPIC
jgi:hypothetical protein